MPGSGESGPSTVCHMFIVSERIEMQKTVLMPKFHPTMNPAISSSTAFSRKTIVPIWTSQPKYCSRAWQTISEKPAAPPPTPLAGRMQPIQANE